MPGRILIVGATGQLGRALQSQIKPLKDVEFLTFSRENLDLMDTKAIYPFLNRFNFDFLINASAYNLTEKAEENPRPAFLINAHAVGEMGRVCSEKGAIFVHVSSDYVFDGQKGEPYSEEDPVCPLNLYGCSKALGEEFARGALKEHYILRTASLYGEGKSNFVKKICAKENVAEVIDDIVMSPTYASDLAGWILALIEKKGPFGTYHAVNQGEASWYNFAKKIVELAGADLVVKPVKSTPGKMKRPQYSALSTSKLESVIGPIKAWEEGLKSYVKGL